MQDGGWRLQGGGWREGLCMTCRGLAFVSLLIVDLVVHLSRAAKHHQPHTAAGNGPKSAAESGTGSQGAVRG
jgi:hypothetical protein